MSNASGKAKYILDANILIGFSIWAPIAFHKSFWSKLTTALENDEWILLDVVVNEITFEGDLKKWCKDQKKSALVKTVTDENRDRAIEINNQYKMIDDVTQNSTADTYIIAYAEANKLGIVTRENHKEIDKHLFKIPDVCAQLGIETIKRPETFLRKIGLANS